MILSQVHSHYVYSRKPDVYYKENEGRIEHNSTSNSRQIPEAAEAAQTMLVGFADMFLLPIRFIDLVFIFLIRTIIALPIIVLIAHLIL